MFCKLFIITFVIISPALGGIQPRITNGVLATNQRKFPYVVSLENDEKWICGGAILKPNVVVTTALCVRNLSPESLSIRAGTLEREDKNGANVQVSKVKKILRHPNYMAEGFHDNDVALLFLKKELQLNEFVNTIKLDTAEFKIKDALIMGWGKNEQFSDNDKLMVAEVFAISNEECQRLYGPKEEITDSMACVRSLKDQVVCRDGGSPVVLRDAEHPRKDILIGLASHSEILKKYVVPIQGGPPVFIKETCDTKKPSIYTRITAVNSWISNQL